MKAITLLLTVICLLFIDLIGISQNQILWNGERSDFSSCDLQYGSADNANPHMGHWCFRATPDAWHQPVINLKCENTWRIDISQMDEIWFYAKANIKGATTGLRASGWPNSSKIVNITPYIAGNSLDTFYKLVRIPIDSLKTDSYQLQSVEYLYFDTSSISGLNIFIDDIQAMIVKPNTVTTYSWLSDHNLRLDINRSYDTINVKDASNYFLSSIDDINYINPVSPAAIGMHYYVKAFDADVPNPLLKHELFLTFPTALQNGASYTLTVRNIRNRSGIDFNSPQSFSFIYNEVGNINHSIKVNQVGYISKGPKYAYIGNYLGSTGVMECSPTAFQIKDVNTNAVVFSGVPVMRGYDPSLSGEKVYECDFKNFEKWGNFYIYVPGIGKSYPFNISDTVYNSTFHTTMRALYYQRCGMALQPPFADARWAHDACHINDGIVHNSWLTSPLYNNEHVNTIMATNGGWHDAGDYGKYIPNGTLAVWRLLFMYELYPEKFLDGELNIPESGNGVPDLLDEVKWQINSEMNMQAPDGGVAERVITTNWSRTKPEQDTAMRFISEKTTFTTAEYAAVLAMAYRCFYSYWPNYADTCLTRAKKAFQFLLAHSSSTPYGGYMPAPGIGSGAYQDSLGDVDERAWAAAELYKATGDSMYHNKFLTWWTAYPPFFGEWNPIAFHQINASFAYATTTKYPVNNSIVASIKNDFLNNYIEPQLVVQTDQNLYRNANRTDVAQWIGWGSFAQSTKYAWFLIAAHYLSGNNTNGNQRYIDYAKINLNSQLGANPQDRSYITGVGSNPPMDPLQQPSLNDGVKEPVPGIPVFGPVAHLSEANVYDAAVESKDNLYPLGEYETDPYPVLRKYFDCHQNVGMSEFSIADEAIVASVFGYFKNDLDLTTLAVRTVELSAEPTLAHTSLVKWKIDADNTRDCILEKSKDGTHFNYLFRINLNKASKDSFIDKNPFNGTTYYRIRLVTNDSIIKYSKIRSVQFKEEAISVFPIPTTGKLFVYWTSKIINPTITISGIDGTQRKINITRGSNNAILLLNGFRPGIYFLQLKTEKQSFIQKIIYE